MARHGKAAQLILRRISLLLALACLWMSSGATLRHTDDLSDLRTFSVGQPAFHHTSPAPSVVSCVAHEWMNAWQTLHTSSVPVVFSSLFLATVQETPTAVLHLRCFDYVSLRAPPPALS